MQAFITDEVKKTSEPSQISIDDDRMFISAFNIGFTFILSYYWLPGCLMHMHCLPPACMIICRHHLGWSPCACRYHERRCTDFLHVSKTCMKIFFLFRLSCNHIVHFIYKKINIATNYFVSHHMRLLSLSPPIKRETAAL